MIFYLSGGGVFLGGDCNVILSSGGGSFLEEGDLAFFFDDVGGVTLAGGNRDFMAKPSDQPAINNEIPRELKGLWENEKN